MSKCLQAYEFSLISYGDRGRRESTLRDGIVQNPEGAGEDYVLLLIRRNRQERRVEWRIVEQGSRVAKSRAVCGILPNRRRTYGRTH